MSFENLPKPQIIEALSFEAILGAIMLDVAARFTAVGVNYDVGNLEVDPVKIVLEVAAFRETLLRARGNSIAMENLVAFSTGTNLDNLAAFYDVSRLVGESDERLRTRVALAISGRSTAGSVDWYKSAAMRADVRVKEASVYRTGKGPELAIAVLSTDNGGLASQAILDAVSIEVNKTTVKVVSDTVNVIAAAATTVNIAAQIWLLPSAPQTVFTGLAAVLRAAHEAESGLGFDLKTSWIIAKLQAAGVSRVVLTSPTADIVVDQNQAVKIGIVSLTDMGRDR